MNSRIILTIFLSMIFLASCKDKDAQTNTETSTQTEAKVKDNIIITISAIVKKDDNFQIYYKDEETEGFTEEKSFYVELKGSESVQDIVFNLPENEFPNYLRLDFGINKEQAPIEIKNLKLSYFDKTVDIKGEDLFEYFYANDSTLKVDKVKGIITPILAADGGYDPMIASADGLRKQLEQLVQQQ